MDTEIKIVCESCGGEDFKLSKWVAYNKVSLVWRCSKCGKNEYFSQSDCKIDTIFEWSTFDNQGD